MLKRTIGRSLLALLVITGLAGTLDDNSLSKKERKYAINLMKETKEQAVQSVRNLNDAQLDFKPAGDKWSVKECMMHIAASEKGLWTLLETTMKGPANPEKRVEIKVTDEQFVQMLEDRSAKYKTSENLQPENTGYSSLPEAVEDFVNQRMEHIKYLKNTTGDMRNHVVQMPFGWIDCYQLGLMVAAHTNRHVQQIKEVKADPGFPAK
jgi:hypothetical protein